MCNIPDGVSSLAPVRCSSFCFFRTAKPRNLPVDDVALKAGWFVRPTHGRRVRCDDDGWFLMGPVAGVHSAIGES